MADVNEIRNRRPIATRSARWAQALARGLAGAGFTPNRVSVLGVFIAAAGATALALSARADLPVRPWLLLAGAAAVQLRLLCNMLDGLIAVENNLKSKLGDLYNEVPDRAEDVLLLVGAGWAAPAPWGIVLGGLAALLAVGSAYVRLLGGSLGFDQDFCGPFAKPQRMFFLTVAALATAVETWLAGSRWALLGGLGLIVVGTAVTIVRRLLRLADAMRKR